MEDGAAACSPSKRGALDISASNDDRDDSDDEGTATPAKRLKLGAAAENDAPLTADASAEPHALEAASPCVAAPAATIMSPDAVLATKGTGGTTGAPVAATTGMDM